MGKGYLPKSLILAPCLVESGFFMRKKVEIKSFECSVCRRKWQTHDGRVVFSNFAFIDYKQVNHLGICTICRANAGGARRVKTG